MAKAEDAVPGAVGDTWRLVWQDEFDGSNGSAPDPAKWSYDTGGDGWGNEELEYYTDSTRNSYIDHGYLVISANKEYYKGWNYTSARLVTRDKAAWNGGRIEVKAKLPYGHGIWPAIWLLPQNDTYGDWRKNGEIDIMEMVGNDVRTVYGSMHYFKNGDLHSDVNSYKPQWMNFTKCTHLYAVERDEHTISWYVDNHKFATKNLDLIFKDPSYQPFQQEFYLLLNIAVGGNWPGDPWQTTVFPQKMLVDYVRVYEKK